MDRILEPFYTTKEIGKGTGLGLSVVREIVEQHNGSIQVESKPDEGTSIHVQFAARKNLVGAPKSVQKTAIRRGKRETILLVEDDDLVRDVTKRILKELNYEVLVTKNGAEALEVFLEKASEIDLAIMDVVLPYSSGLDIFKKIRLSAPRLPVLFITGYSLNPGINKIGQNEQNHTMILQKPYSIRTLGQNVRGLFSHQG